MENYADAFLEEAYELIAELEDSLLSLEEDSDNQEMIDRIFRAMHTIKGSGGMCGYDDIAGFTHELETVFDLVRERKLPVTEELIELALSSRDQIKQMLDAVKYGTAVDEDRSADIIKSLESLVFASVSIDISEESTSVNTPGEHTSSDQEEQSEEKTYRIRFIPNSEIFRSGMNPIPLLKELHELGVCTIVAQTGKIPSLNALKNLGRSL